MAVFNYFIQMLILEKELTTKRFLQLTKLKVNKKKNKITITKRSNRHVLFEGDGKYYQTYKQWKDKNKGADNIAMRDAHVISVKGKRYLIFGLFVKSC